MGGDRDHAPPPTGRPDSSDVLSLMFSHHGESVSKAETIVTAVNSLKRRPNEHFRQGGTGVEPGFAGVPNTSRIVRARPYNGRLRHRPESSERSLEPIARRAVSGARRRSNRSGRRSFDGDSSRFPPRERDETGDDDPVGSAPGADGGRLGTARILNRRGRVPSRRSSDPLRRRAKFIRAVTTARTNPNCFVLKLDNRRIVAAVGEISSRDSSDGPGIGERRTGR